MYRSLDGTHVAAVIYYVCLVLFNAYFMMNLFLAVIKLKFARAQLAQDKRARSAAAYSNTRRSIISSHIGYASKHF